MWCRRLSSWHAMSPFDRAQLRVFTPSGVTEDLSVTAALGFTEVLLSLLDTQIATVLRSKIQSSKPAKHKKQQGPKPCSTPMSAPFPLLLLPWHSFCSLTLEWGAGRGHSCGTWGNQSVKRLCPIPSRGTAPPAASRSSCSENSHAKIPALLVLEAAPCAHTLLPACCNCRNAASSQLCPWALPTTASQSYSSRETRNCFAVMVTTSIEQWGTVPLLLLGNEGIQEDSFMFDTAVCKRLPRDALRGKNPTHHSAEQSQTPNWTCLLTKQDQESLEGQVPSGAAADTDILWNKNPQNRIASSPWESLNECRKELSHKKIHTKKICLWKMQTQECVIF